MSVPESSRALLLPGPQPPLSHFGATLLKHVVATGLRYALHSLGAPMPEGAPVRIVGLRLYLSRAKLAAALGDAPAAAGLIAALLEPGGAGTLPAGAARVRGAAAFHRTRLRLGLRRRARAAIAPPPEAAAAELQRQFRATVSGQQPALGDALLGELLASLARRARRARGSRVEPCLGRQAFAALTGSAPDLTALGIADPLATAWSELPAAVDELRRRRGELPTPEPGRRPHPLRGGFREAYRRALDPIRAAYLRLAAEACRRGVLDEVGDAFFVPFDLSEDLTVKPPPAWLPRAVASNRAEYQGLLEAGSPPESIAAGDRPRTMRDRGRWMLGPVWPLE